MSVLVLADNATTVDKIHNFHYETTSDSNKTNIHNSTDIIESRKIGFSPFHYFLPFHALCK